MKKILSLIALLALVSVPAFADVGYRSNGSGHTNITTIDAYCPSGSDCSSQTGLTRKFAALDSSLYATGVSTGGATSVVSTTVACPIGYAYVRKVIPSNNDATFTAGTLADGKPGQILTVAVAGLSPSGATSGGNYTITPTTSYGFTSVKLTAVKDFVRFQFIDGTTGWVILDFGGTVTVNLKA